MVVLSNYTGKNNAPDQLITSFLDDLRSLNLDFQRFLNIYSSAPVKTSAYTVTSQDYIILVNTGSAVTITLPTAVGIRGKQYIIKDYTGTANSNNITIATTGGQTIDGAAGSTISTNYGKLYVVSNNVNWSVL